MWLSSLINIHIPYTKPLMEFSNKVVVITGANSEIATATAKIFAEYGAQLILVSKSAEEIQKVSDELVKFHGKIPLLITADVTKEEGVKKVESETINHFGKVDVIVNVEGEIKFDSILKPNLQVFDDSITLNLRPVYIMTSTFARHLMKSKGNIVNVGSVFSNVIYTGQVSYNIAKLGIDYLTKASALELSNKGVRVNCVKPGLMKVDDKVSWADITKMIPLAKLVDGQDVAHAIAYLASAQAKNVTGTSIIVDGGLALSGTTVIDRIRTAFD